MDLLALPFELLVQILSFTPVHVTICFTKTCRTCVSYRREAWLQTTLLRMERARTTMRLLCAGDKDAIRLEKKRRERLSLHS